MLEMLVLSFCLYDFECNNLTKAYLAHNKELKQNAKTFGKYVMRTEPEAALFTVITYSSLGAEKLRLRVAPGTTLEWKFKKEEIKVVTLNWRYDF